MNGQYVLENVIREEDVFTTASVSYVLCIKDTYEPMAGLALWKPEA